MQKVAVITDSIACLPREFAEQHNIGIIPIKTPNASDNAPFAGEVFARNSCLMRASILSRILIPGASSS